MKICRSRKFKLTFICPLWPLRLLSHGVFFNAVIGRSIVRLGTYGHPVCKRQKGFCMSKKADCMRLHYLGNPFNVHRITMIQTGSGHPPS